MKDNRPDPRPRKHAELWQTYLIYSEFESLSVKHANRRSSIERGKSNFSMDIEMMLLDEFMLEKYKDQWRKIMNGFASQISVYEWVTSIKGIGDSLACKLLAQIDDIEQFATISKLWRFSGYAVIDGQREYNKPGEKSHFNKTLKSVCFLIVESFIKQQTPIYADIYYMEKERLRRIHPEKIVNGNGKTKYNDGHLHAMAMRKTAKIFLQHLWLVWRTLEGLPVSDPYIHEIGGHTHIIPPPNFEPVSA